MKRYAIIEVPYDFLYSQALKKSGIAYFIFTVKKKKKKGNKKISQFGILGENYFFQHLLGRDQS